MPPVSVRINCLGCEADSYRTKEWYGFTDAGRKWLQDKGCEWTKITAEPGDLLLCKLFTILTSIANVLIDRGLAHAALQSLVENIAAQILRVYVLHAGSRRQRGAAPDEEDGV